MSKAGTRQDSEELGKVGYELFIAGISILSVINFALELLPLNDQIKAIAQLMEGPYTIILLLDFGHRLLKSHPRSDYFIRRRGYLDLLGCLPGLKIFRLFRVVRVIRLLRQHGGPSIVRDVMRHRAENALYIILFLVLVLLQYGSMAVLAAENTSPEANIKTGPEAVWWAFVSVTTVGYGDYTPVTGWGRAFAILVLAAGVGLFGSLSGFLANFFLSPNKTEAEATIAEARDALRMLAQVEANLAEQMQAIAAIRAAITAQPSQEVGKSPDGGKA